MSALLLSALAASTLSAPVAHVAPAPPRSAADSILVAVPERAVLVLSVEGIEALRERGQKNAWYRFLSDERVKSLANEVLPQELKDGFEAPEGAPFDPWRLVDSVRGSAALFLSPGADDDSVVGGVLVLPGSERAAFEDEFDAMLDAMAEETGAEPAEYGGAELLIAEIDKEPGDLPFDATSLVVIGFEREELAGVLVGFPREAVLEAVHGAIDRWRGEDPSPGISTHADLTAARAAIGRADGPELFLRAGELTRLAMKDRDPAEQSQQVLRMLGLFDVHWAYGSAGIGEGEKLELSFGAHLPEASGLARFAALAGPISPELFRLMPETSLSVTAFHFDVAGAIELVVDMITEFEKDARKGYEESLAQFGTMAGIDIRTEILDQLTGHVGTFTVRGAPGTATGIEDIQRTLPKSGYVVGLLDSDTVSLAIDSLLDSPLGGMASAIESEDFQGYEVLTFPGPFGDPAFAWSFCKTGIVLSDDVETVRGVLRSAGNEDAPSALKNDKFGPVIRSAGAVSLLSIADTPEMLKEALGALVSLLGMVELGETAELGRLLGAFEPAMIDEYFSGAIVQTAKRGAQSVSFRLVSR